MSGFGDEPAAKTAVQNGSKVPNSAVSGALASAKNNVPVNLILPIHHRQTGRIKLTGVSICSRVQKHYLAAGFGTNLPFNKGERNIGSCRQQT